MSSPDAERARLERLIAAADRVATQPIPPPPRRARGASMAVLAVLGVGALGLGVKMCTSDDTLPDASIESSAQPTAAPTVVPTVPPTTVPAGSTTSIPTVITLPPLPSTTALTPSTQPSPSTTWVPVPGQPVRSAEYANDQLRLVGAVPDSRAAASLLAKWTAAFGAGKVTQEYVIAIGVPRPTDEPLLAAETMQFPTASAELQPPALTLLNHLAALLQQNPTVTLDIDGYIDGSGDPAADQQLTDFRVGAVVIYLVGQGIDPARLHATGHGSSAPVADDTTDAGRALNRRIDFTVHHLLD